MTLFSLKNLLIAAFISASTCPAAVQYMEDGNLNSTNEVQRWLVNRARYAPEKEADYFNMTNTTSGGTPDYDCCEDADGANDMGTTVEIWAAWKASKPPLAPNALLSIAAAKHTLDMSEQVLLTHNSPSANYYPLGSEPGQRITIEGYTNNITGYYENIAYGARGTTSTNYPAYGRTPEDAHEGWWVDTDSSVRGHRQAILNPNAREIGLGHCMAWNFDGTYRWTYDWYTEDFGRRTGKHFFTGTIFYDANDDKAYSIGEGIGGIEIHLLDNGTEGAYYDVSTSAGSFAIPIADHVDGHTITVQLINKTGVTKDISIPIGWATFAKIQLTNNEVFNYGTFTQPATDANVGFRQTNPTVKTSEIGLTGSESELNFSALPGATYSVLTRTNLMTGNWVVLTQFTATASTETVVDPFTTNAPSKFYRIQLDRDGD